MDQGRGRVYIGERTSELPGETAVSVEEGGCRWPLPHVAYHSPAGLSWGYHGSGPADCALSILADALGERPTPAQLRRGEPRCWRWHQAFKRDVIARCPQGAGFRLALVTVEAWIARQRQREAVREAADA